MMMEVAVLKILLTIMEAAVVLRILLTMTVEAVE